MASDKAERDRKLRVVEILEATVGGTRRQVEQIFTSLNAPRIRFGYVYSAERDRGYRHEVNRFQEFGIVCHEVPMLRSVSPLRDLKALCEITSILRSAHCDIVHTHSSKAGLLGRVAAWLVGVPRVYYTPHVYYFPSRSGLSRWFFTLLEWAAGRLTTQTICLSEGQRRRAVRSGVVRPGRVVVVENGVDVDHFGELPPKDEARRALGLKPDAPTVAMVARLSARKGADRFAQAAPKIVKRNPGVQFAVAGEGDMRPEVERLIAELGLQDRFHLLGYVEDPRLVYGAADVCVLTSRHEGLPYALLEAMAARLPLVATDVPGNRDAIRDGEMGFLVTFGDDDAFAERVCRLLADSDLRARMGAAGRLAAETRFCLKRFAERMERVFIDGT